MGRPYRAAEAIRQRCGQTFVTPIRLGGAEMNGLDVQTQMRSLKQLAGTMNNVLPLIEGEDSTLKSVAKKLGTSLSKQVKTDPKCTTPYLFQTAETDRFCGYDTNMCNNRFGCKWVSRMPNSDSPGCIKYNNCNFNSKEKCINVKACQWGALGVPTRSPTAARGFSSNNNGNISKNKKNKKNSNLKKNKKQKQANVNFENDDNDLSNNDDIISNTNSNNRRQLYNNNNNDNDFILENVINNRDLNGQGCKYIGQVNTIPPNSNNNNNNNNDWTNKNKNKNKNNKKSNSKSDKTNKNKDKKNKKNKKNKKLDDVNSTNISKDKKKKLINDDNTNSESKNKNKSNNNKKNKKNDKKSKRLR